MSISRDELQGFGERIAEGVLDPNRRGLLSLAAKQIGVKSSDASSFQGGFRTRYSIKPDPIRGVSYDLAEKLEAAAWASLGLIARAEIASVTPVDMSCVDEILRDDLAAGLEPQLILPATTGSDLLEPNVLRHHSKSQGDWLDATGDGKARTYCPYPSGGRKVPCFHSLSLQDFEGIQTVIAYRPYPILWTYPAVPAEGLFVVAQNLFGVNVKLDGFDAGVPWVAVSVDYRWEIGPKSLLPVRG